MVAHSSYFSCFTSRRGPTWSLMPIAVHVPVLGEDHTWSLTPVGICVPTLGEDRHGLSCPFVFVFQSPLLVRTTHGRLLPFVFLFPVRAAWSLTPVSVPVSGEDRTWSLTLVIFHVPDPGEDRHDRSCPLRFMFQFSVRITHGHSRPLVFVV